MQKLFCQLALISLLTAALLNSKALGQETAERAKLKRYRPDTHAPGAEIWSAVKSTGQNSTNKTSAGANQDWVIMLNEDFESGFPQTNRWTLLWSSLAPYSWDDVSFNPHSGARSAWCADGQSTIHDPPSNFETNPHRIRVSIANLTKPAPPPGGSAQTAYRMISIPTELDQTQIGAVLADDLGAYDDTRWRFFRFEDGNFLEFPDPKAAAFAPGKAFWLIVQEANKTIDAGSSLSFSTADSFTITLQPGWNDIGLPFDFPVNWSQVRVNRSSVDGPYLYEGTWRMPPDVSRLEPWKGYAVRNLGTVPLTLKIPPRAADATSA
ncbi:MAG: hypothetical protein ACRENG_27465, partial [bacterium]